MSDIYLYCINFCGRPSIIDGYYLDDGKTYDPSNHQERKYIRNGSLNLFLSPNGLSNSINRYTYEGRFSAYLNDQNEFEVIVWDYTSNEEVSFNDFIKRHFE